MPDFNIQEILQFVLLAIVPFLFAITVHEAMHGFAAYKLGDHTAKALGRLTLNPIAHIDPLGLLCLLVTRTFGWAKPVPVNFYKIRHPYGMAIVAAAGPLSNLALAFISVIVLKILTFFAVKFAMPKSVAEPLIMMVYYSIHINVVLFVFNLLPILPLDGGRILTNFLPREAAIKFSAMERYGFIIIIIFAVSGAARYVISPPINYIVSALMSI